MEEVKMSESKKSIHGSKLAAMKYPKSSDSHGKEDGPEIPSNASSSQKPPLPHPVDNKYPADPLEIEDAPSSVKPPLPPVNNKYPSGPEDIDDDDTENKYPSPPKEFDDAPSSKKPLPAPIDNKYPSGPKIDDSSSLPPPSSPKPNGKKCNFIQKLLKKVVKKYSNC
uniref:Uncharacterized protein n=1 Tax=Meloidogyne javanica TaxID=6303 RepID=A0A915N7D0_MELJA